MDNCEGTMEDLDQELRFYCFVNFYLSSIQQGIQTGHCAVDLVMKYLVTSPLRYDEYQRSLVQNWANLHKTFITLNGGPAAGIDAAEEAIVAAVDFPWVAFYEDEVSLKGLKTCVGVVVPAYIFNAKFSPEETRAAGDGQPRYAWEQTDPNTGVLTGYRVYHPQDQHYPLVHLLKSSRLAS